jgi:hypothetical protein
MIKEAKEKVNGWVNRPVDRGWFSVTIVVVVITLMLAIASGARIYGQAEKQIENNRENINFLKDHNLRYEIEIDVKLTVMNDTLRQQHGILSGIAATLEAMQRERAMAPRYGR